MYEYYKYQPLKTAIRLMDQFSSLYLIQNMNDEDNYKKMASLAISLNIFSLVICKSGEYGDREKETSISILDKNLANIDPSFSHRTSIDEIVFFYYGAKGLDVYQTLHALGYNSSTNDFWKVFNEYMHYNDNTNNYGIVDFSM